MNQLVQFVSCGKTAVSRDFFNWGAPATPPKWVRLLATLLFLTYSNWSFAQASPASADPVSEQVQQTLKENAQSIRFMENKGQLANSDVLYYFENYHSAVYIERNRIRFVAIDDTLIAQAPNPKTGVVVSPKHAAAGTHTFSLYFDGANAGRTLQLGESFGTNYHYMMGTDPGSCVSGVKAAKDLTLKAIYPGIDLRLYSAPGGVLEFDWLVAPGADYSQVQMRFEGQDALAVDPDGNLRVALRFTGVKINIPESYQVTDKGKIPVRLIFTPTNDHTVAFAAQSEIDPRYALVIDPTLSWGTFMDGNLSEFDAYLYAIQVDAADGIVYCAGATNRNIPTNSAPYDADGYVNTINITNGSTGANARPYVAVVYRLSASGTDLLDLTLYGPAAISGNSNQVVAHALSLSANNVFIGGTTTVDVPTTGSPFDGTRNGTDGFVAVFPKNLGALTYATYLGSSGTEDLGVTSIRALSDNSFVVGATVAAALPAGYISAGAAQTAFGGGMEMYIAKFTSMNTLSWGTYVGGSSDETFNDLEVFGDGRVAFCGYGAGQLTEVNSAAGRSTSTDEDGIIGVLNATGTGFNYLDEIGGSGDDRINDVEILGETLYWTGSASSGFPVTVGAYDTSHNGGGTDAVVGKVSSGGSAAGFAATYYGSGSMDIGSGIQTVSQTNCSGDVTTMLLVFGTVGGTGLPTLNSAVPGTFFKSTYTSGGNSGLDMFFAEFNSTLSTLGFGTYMGGNQDDYLGDTGDPRGGNHLWVNNAQVYLGTTTHSASHSPTLVSGGFDTGKSNGTNDSHLIISVSFASLVETDYSDAPASYGAPSHTLDCTHLRIGANLDADAGPLPNAAADGDDNDQAPDDEDGITVFPTLNTGSGQNISITVNNLLNTTGSTATLYAWIDLNSDGQFQAGEFASTAVPNNTINGSIILNWTNVTVSGSATGHYLRIRLTTNVLSDNGGTAAVDERSTASASNGEVEDYLLSAISGADLSLTKIVNNPTPNVNDNVIFTITIHNAGPSQATNVLAGDPLPAGYMYVSDNGAGAYNSGTGVWTVGPLNNGQDKSLQITAKVLAAGSYQNTAQVTASDQSDPDSTPNNNNPAEDDQASASVLTASGAATDALCNGGTGKITLTMNGAGPFDIAWNGPGANDGTANNQNSGYMITNLPAGSYAISVTENNGIQKTFNTSVSEPLAVSATATPTDARCNGASTGKITMTISGGTGLYDIAWDGPGANDGTAINQNSGYMIANLPAGMYNITVTDDNGCTKTTSATVSQPAVLSVTATPAHVLCNGASTGKITVTISGGTGLYDIAWDGPSGNSGAVPNQNSGYMIASLPAGNYSITVTDDNGCTKTTSATINEPAALAATATPAATTCNGGSNGKITMTISGGTGLYDINWDGPGANDGSANNQNSGYMITSLPAGMYNITVTDDNSCTKTTSATVNQPAAVSATAAPTDAFCNGASTGKITMTISGGTGLYDIAWDGPGANDGTVLNQNSGYMITSLPAGNYYITVTDDNGCTKTTSATVNQPAAVSATATPTGALCNGGNGKITMALSGGVAPYDIAWDGPGANDGTVLNQNSGYMITGLPAGNYNITVTDDNGCAKTTSATVSQPAAVTLSATPTHVLCSGGTGKITLTLGGGVGPYDIAWDGPGANDGLFLDQNSGYMITNLPAGAYAITATDENGCSTNTSTMIMQPQALTASATPTNASCTGDSNGKITLTIGGGVIPYDISWDGPGANDGAANNQNSGYMIANLPEGAYAITVTDDNGCTKTTSATISANPLPNCSISDPMATVCPNSTGNHYSASAGMDVYAWSISGNGSIPGPTNGPAVDATAGASGTYTVSVTITKNGCSATCMKQVMITTIPFMIVYTPQYCPDDLGPVIGLNGSEAGAMYQLQTGAGANIGAPKPGTGSAITFGAYPNGNYKVVITGGTCNGTLMANVNASIGNCNISVPDYCTCSSANGYTEITVKITAPDGQTWKVKDVTGLYTGSGPYAPLPVGTLLTPVGGNMYTLTASRSDTKGFWVQVTNGFTELDVMVGNASW